MSALRRFPTAVGRRVETGTIRFGDDWPGVFIRGDEAQALAQTFRHIATTTPHPQPLEEMAKLLESCKVDEA